MPVDLAAIDADFYAWTGHKALGPTGVGVLHARAEILEQMPPFLAGGDMIASVDVRAARPGTSCPWKFEAGTSMIAQVVGLGAAIDYLDALGMDAVRAHERALTAYALERLGERSRACACSGRPSADASRRRGLLRDRGHPPARRRRAAQPPQRLHPRQPSLRAAADAPPRASTRPRARASVPTTCRRRRRAGRRDRATAQEVFGV